MHRRRFSVATLAALSPAWPLSSAAAQPAARRTAPATPFLYREHPAALAFAEELAARRQLDPAWVREQIGQAQRLQAAIRGVTPPARGVPKNWAAYRARFVEPIRLA